MKWILVLLFSGMAAQSSVLPVKLDSQVDTRAPRWMFGEKSRRSGKGIVRNLEQIKRFQMNGKYVKCTERARSSGRAAPSLAPWLAVAELNCATKSFENKKTGTGPLNGTIVKIERNTRWLTFGPQREALRQALVTARLALLRADVRRNRKRAWKAVDRLLMMKEWASKSQQADVYKLAGDLAFIEQKMKAARGFVLQSIALQNSQELQEKLTAIEKALSKTEPVDAEFTGPAAKPLVPVADEATEFEFRLEKRVKTALSRGDVVSAVEDSMKLLEQFSGGRRALWAQKRILEAYFKSLKLSGDRVFSARKKILSVMKKADGIRLQKWAGRLFQRGQYQDALVLANEASNKLDGSNRQKKSLRTAAFSSIYVDDLKQAKELFQKVIDKNSGSQEAVDSTLRLGLIYYREKEYSKAITFFEKLLYLSGAKKFELTARYWLWRCFQKTKPERAEEERIELINRFPLTYYGLRARAEGQKQVLHLPDKVKKKKIEGQVWMTNQQRLAWERMNLLLRGGWFDEAQAELNFLPPAQNARERLIFSRYWAAILDYPKAIKMTREATPQQARLNTRRFINLSYPQEFTSSIKAQAKRYGLDENLVKSLIRQESAFYPKAVSRSNALGLMQLIPPTAKEQASEVGIKDFQMDALFDPNVNLKLGSHYLAKMLKRFGQNVPLALAAYNAGPTRLSRWLSNRKVLSEVANSNSSSPEVEIWIDELPWSETNFYVKSILRNLMVYRMLDEGRISLGEPLWR